MSFAHLHTCTLSHLHTTRSVSCKSYLIFIFILFFVIGCFMSTMYNLLHIPLCTVMLILIFNSTAYCHAHSFTFYILFFISYFSFILSYVYFPCVVFSIFALSMERTRLSFHCWLYSLCIVVYVTNKTWNLKLENLKQRCGSVTSVSVWLCLGLMKVCCSPEQWDRAERQTGLGCERNFTITNLDN